MKPLFLITLFVSLGAALETAAPLLEARQARQRRPATRPETSRGEARLSPIQRPLNAPVGYRVDTAAPSRRRLRSGLTRLPPQFIDNRRRKRDEFRARRDALTRLRGRQQALDFYECENVNPAPRSQDCNVIIDQVYAANQDILIPTNACVIFEFGTCRGFFCSLCTNLRVNTNFIGNQLLTADTLCVSNGQAGTAVGTEPPQWDAGFVRAGAGLPSYDVC
ncbi:hypothetical protein RB594_007797 [Gaeumannomyces avenae]